MQLASTDLARQPPIWLPTPSDEDVVVLCHAVRRALDVLVTCAFQAICTASLAVPLTELERLGPWVRASAYSLPHTVETCAMGASPDTGAVVDAAGQVYGVTGLYVVDASILPGPPTGFPHLVTLMMASRITDRLLTPATPRPPTA